MLQENPGTDRREWWLSRAASQADKSIMSPLAPWVLDEDISDSSALTHLRDEGDRRFQRRNEIPSF